MKKIACGSVKEHIKTNEAIKSYEQLRDEVLTMALFSPTECNKINLHQNLADGYRCGIGSNPCSFATITTSAHEQFKVCVHTNKLRLACFA